MPATMKAYELVDGASVERLMFPVDAYHAVKVDPARWSLAPHKVEAEAAPEPDMPADEAEAQEGDEPTDLPMLPRSRGRPRKDGGAV